MTNSKRLTGILLIAVALIIQGCGFHLRGTQSTTATLPQSISPLHVAGLEQGNYLKGQLENRLIDSNIQILADSADAASTLRIGSLKSDRRVLAVDSRGKILEYLLTESLRFDLVDAQGVELVPAQTVNMTQAYINPEDQVLGALQEERSLREDMWRRMVDQILRRMAAQLR